MKRKRKKEKEKGVITHIEESAIAIGQKDGGTGRE